MNIALLTAGGVGNRMGQDIPKQFMCIDNIPVIIYTLQAFQYCEEIDVIAVVCLKGWEAMLQAYANQHNISKLKWIFEGGETNQDSIKNGVYGLKSAGANENDIVVIHDGVRPLITHDIICNNIQTCKTYGYAVTGLVCKEAIMELKEDCVTQIQIPRERLVRTQTPHTYKLHDLVSAYQVAQEKGVNNTVAACTLFAALGHEDQHLVQGSEKNGLKLTHSEDVEIFKAMKNSVPEAWLK